MTYSSYPPPDYHQPQSYPPAEQPSTAPVVAGWGDERTGWDTPTAAWSTAPTRARVTPPRSGEHLLDVRDLWVEFGIRDGVARVVNGVSFHVDPGETLAILGESGSGKSVTAQAVMGILDSPPAVVRGGQVRFGGEDLLTVAPERRRQVRGQEIAMIFQDALSALNPVYPVGWQITEALRSRRGISKSDARRRAVELMDLVQIPAASQRVDDYPHQFSGGMRQRVMIAMALALRPKVLIADEPTTALDVTVQAQIMDLLATLRAELEMALILITHDLGVVADVADRITVMYAGRVVEHADVHTLYGAPAHPYTRGLLASVPRLEYRGHGLHSISGTPPNPVAIPEGCAFHPRCPWAQQVCRMTEPPLTRIGRLDRASACHFPPEALDARLA
ncbi:ABC transporter ATP-binding protein [Asanoa sp. WMMD1127]|uniref:ABC transporter ATP-binding protein n=1 Tax=Asanoa sp. WMMD1127 TaxID=3016107 RepID=UPI002415DDCF|nr:ABC transporter ATP-binding protein [Asanoa sp. WMMD1127]MDG4821077.1 ABC transporter ATP-binding protein [Asanoa sp. WMMD1127]